MKILESSKRNGDISLTVKGILVGLAPVLIAVMALSGVEIAESDYMQGVESVVAFISATMILVGVLRKVYYTLFK